MRSIEARTTRLKWWTSSLSKWTHYEVDPPPGLRESSAIIYLAIIITNILILVTFRRMRKLTLQHHLMISLALFDLLTVPAQVPVMVALWKQYILLTDVLCNAIRSSITQLLLQQHGCISPFVSRNIIPFRCQFSTNFSSHGIKHLSLRLPSPWLS